MEVIKKLHKEQAQEIKTYKLKLENLQTLKDAAYKVFQFTQKSLRVVFDGMICHLLWHSEDAELFFFVVIKLKSLSEYDL